MEERAGADHILLPDQRGTALADNLFEILDGLEIGVDQWLVDELPEVLGGLHLGAMRRLKHEPDAVWDCQVFRAVPSSVIELKDDALAPACACRFGEVQKDRLKHFLANRVRNVPDRSPGGRLHEAPHVEPFVAVMAKRYGALALGRPNPPQDGLQADIVRSSSAPLKVLIHRPDLDGGFRVLLFFFSGSVLQFF